MVNKTYISANELLEDSFALGGQILDSNFEPDIIIGLWRGGAAVAVAIHELMAYCGVATDHIPLKTQLYNGINKRGNKVSIDGLEYLAKRKRSINNLLLVDDVFDTGKTMDALMKQLSKLFIEKTTDIRIATVWYKPEKSECELRPDYFLHTTDSWLVFPHELQGLEKKELLLHKSGIGRIKNRL